MSKIPSSLLTPGKAGFAQPKPLQNKYQEEGHQLFMFSDCKNVLCGNKQQ
jgi:hypothetical protein